MFTIFYIEIMKTLNLLRLYKKQQNVNDKKSIEHLNDAEKKFRSKHVAFSKQQKITKYFQ